MHYHTNGIQTGTMGTKRTVKKSLDGIEYIEGSDNTFADIGIPNHEETMAKAQVARCMPPASGGNTLRNHLCVLFCNTVHNTLC